MGSEVEGERFAGAGNYAFDPVGEPLRTPDDLTFEWDLKNPPRAAVNTLDDFADIREVEVFGEG